MKQFYWAWHVGPCNFQENANRCEPFDFDQYIMGLWESQGDIGIWERNFDSLVRLIRWKYIWSILLNVNKKFWNQFKLPEIQKASIFLHALTRGEKILEQVGYARFILCFKISHTFLRAKQVGEKSGKFQNPKKIVQIQISRSNIIFPSFGYCS